MSLSLKSPEFKFLSLSLRLSGLSMFVLTVWGLGIETYLSSLGAWCVNGFGVTGLVGFRDSML